MKKINFFTVNAADIFINHDENQDYISLNDLIKASNQDKTISDWLRNKNTIEFLKVWETINNTDFNYGGFAIIKNALEIPNFKVSAKEWISKTNGKGLKAKTGKYGGTYAHKDIAFEFCMWISPEFKYLVIKEFQRLKDQEAIKAPWNNKRLIAGVNYRLQTDAIQENIIPYDERPEFAIYADEGDLINIAVFGKTAKTWEKENPECAAKNQNMRDKADIYQLIVVANMEALNSTLISKLIPKEQRHQQIISEAQRQLQTFYKSEIKGLKNFSN